MILLRTIYRYECFLEYYFVFFYLGVHMVKLCHEKILLLRCILPKINLLPTPLKNLEHPDKKLNSLGIILIP